MALRRSIRSLVQRMNWLHRWRDRKKNVGALRTHESALHVFPSRERVVRKLRKRLHLTRRLNKECKLFEQRETRFINEAAEVLNIPKINFERPESQMNFPTEANFTSYMLGYLPIHFPISLHFYALRRAALLRLEERNADDLRTDDIRDPHSGELLGRCQYRIRNGNQLHFQIITVEGAMDRILQQYPNIPASAITPTVLHGGAISKMIDQTITIPESMIQKEVRLVQIYRKMESRVESYRSKYQKTNPK